MATQQTTFDKIQAFQDEVRKIPERMEEGGDLPSVTGKKYGEIYAAEWMKLLQKHIKQQELLNIIKQLRDYIANPDIAPEDSDHLYHEHLDLADSVLSHPESDDEEEEAESEDEEEESEEYKERVLRCRAAYHAQRAAAGLPDIQRKSN